MNIMTSKRRAQKFSRKYSYQWKKFYKCDNSKKNSSRLILTLHFENTTVFLNSTYVKGVFSQPKQ